MLLSPPSALFVLFAVLANVLCLVLLIEYFYFSLRVTSIDTLIDEWAMPLFFGRGGGGGVRTARLISLLVVFPVFNRQEARFVNRMVCGVFGLQAIR